MTEDTAVQEHPTGETCPGCEREVMIVFRQADELQLGCDCGDTLALGPLVSAA